MLTNKPAILEEYRFADADIERVVFESIYAELGDDPGAWDHINRYDARLLCDAMSTFTKKTLTFRPMRDAILRRGKKRGIRRGLVMEFLYRFMDLYEGEDADHARKLIPLLYENKNGYWVLFHDRRATSFRNFISINAYGNRYFYCLQTDDRLILDLLAAFFFTREVNYITYPSCRFMERLVSIIVKVFSRRGVTGFGDMDQEVFFDLVDEARQMEEWRTLTSVFVMLYRYGIESLGFNVDGGPYIERDTFFMNYLIHFLFREYTCRENTFVVNRRDPGWSRVPVDEPVPHPSLRGLVSTLINGGKLSSYEYRVIKGHLFRSLGEPAGRDWSQFRFTEDMFFRQAAYYRKLLKDRPDRFLFAVGGLRVLYLTVNELSGGAFLREAKVLTYGVLTTPCFIKYVEEGYEFTHYSPYVRVDSGKKRVFIVVGFDTMKKSLLREDYISVNFSSITDSFYRSQAWLCVTSTRKRLYRVGLPYTLRYMLPYLYRLKQTEGYRSPNHREFTVWDAVKIAEFFGRISNTDLTYNSFLTDVRDFLRWAQGEGQIKVDPLVFSLLCKRKIAHQPTDTPVVPTDHMTRLGAHMTERSKKELWYAQAFIIMNLLAITPIRVGTICRFRKDELTFDRMLNSYVFKGTSKGTHGGAGTIALGSKANGLIDRALQLSEIIGADCPDPGMRDYVFVCQVRLHYDVFSSSHFRRILRRCCDECGLPPYGANNLRATYMTNVYLEASANGRTDEFMLKLFSYHRNKSTTLEHYVNHEEALAMLTDFLKKGSDWEKTVYPDERKALQMVIEDLRGLLAEAGSEGERTALRADIRNYERLLEKISN